MVRRRNEKWILLVSGDQERVQVVDSFVLVLVS
jgi:hypothetical protein